MLGTIIGLWVYFEILKLESTEFSDVQVWRKFEGNKNILGFEPEQLEEWIVHLLR